ncbi:Chaperone protein DnaJ [Bienertia sinuspersici]
MSSISQNPDPKTHEDQNQDPKTTENQNPETSNQPVNPDEKGKINDEEREKVAEEEEEEGECGFCLFMKGGGCKDEFVAWELCVEESEKNEEDIVEKCFEVTANLKKCMEAHSDYYEPILRAEKAAEEEVKQELERESESVNNDQNSGSTAVEERAEFEVQKNG